jgi:hypothetical protein
MISFTLRRFTPEEGAPGTQCIGGWMGPRAGLNVIKKGKSLTPKVNGTWTRQVVLPAAELSRLIRAQTANIKFRAKSIEQV